MEELVYYLQQHLGYTYSFRVNYDINTFAPFISVARISPFRNILTIHPDINEYNETNEILTIIA